MGLWPQTRRKTMKSIIKDIGIESKKKKIGGGFGKLKMYITQVLWNRRLAFGRRLERQLRREEKGERERGKK